MTRIRIQACGWEEKYLLGESIALDGACQTVTAFSPHDFQVEASPETLRRTTLGSWRQGNKVNLERALRLSDRLGGHLVLGHIDGVSRLACRKPEGGSLIMGFDLDPAWALLVVEKGSIAVNGVSLTVSRLESKRFYVSLIPESAQRTTLVNIEEGCEVNIETDIIGKYLARFAGKSSFSEIQEDFLKRCGFGF
jgi:riboflavin synthase